MDKGSIFKNPVEEALRQAEKEGRLPKKFAKNFAQFYESYRSALETAHLAADPTIFTTFLELVIEQCASPFPFSLYHQKIRTPFDYYQWGIDFLRPLIDQKKSTANNLNIADKISKELSQGENAILLANHQIEADPQVISILLSKTHPQLAEKIIYIAGERVVTDPLAIPFSMGCDLLCIYSKRYIDHPPDAKKEKLLHNQRTMEKMRQLLQEGGKIIYVAPSGGRDRKNSKGIVPVAPFDPQSIEMIYLMAERAKTPTHFYPFSLATYDLLPPPKTIQKELGESRPAKFSPVHLSFGEEFDMQHFPGSDLKDKMERRARRAKAIWSAVNKGYQALL